MCFGFLYVFGVFDLNYVGVMGIELIVWFGEETCIINVFVLVLGEIVYFMSRLDMDLLADCYFGEFFWFE